MQWGLVPSFTPPEQRPDFFKMFNARSETLLSKAVFSRLKSKRCVVLFQGWYEWKAEGKHKQPFYIHDATRPTMKMAGLYDAWHDADGVRTRTFTLLTTAATTRVRWLHHRMPLLLQDDASVEAWLSEEQLTSAVLSDAVASVDDTALEWHAVTPAMSRLGYESPDACKPINRPNIASFFGNGPSTVPEKATASTRSCQTPEKESSTPPGTPTAKLDDERCTPLASSITSPAVKLEEGGDRKLPPNSVREGNSAPSTPPKREDDCKAPTTPTSAKRAAGSSRLASTPPGKRSRPSVRTPTGGQTSLLNFFKPPPQQK